MTEPIPTLVDDLTAVPDRHGYRSALRHPTALQLLVEFVDALAEDTGLPNAGIERATDTIVAAHRHAEDQHPAVGELQAMGDATTGARFLDAALKALGEVLGEVLAQRDALGTRVDPRSCGGYLS